MAQQKILIFGDGRQQYQIIKWVLRGEFDVHVAEDLEAAMDAIWGQAPSVLLLDLGHPPEYKERLRLISRIRTYGGATKVIVYGDPIDREAATQAMHNGASGFLPKPIDFNLLKCLIYRTFWMARLEQENIEVSPDPLKSFEGMIGADKSILQVFSSIIKVAAIADPVLIFGESGTGKELTARAIHRRSPRKDGPFVPINCGAIPENLLESELFGFEKGSFTGASQRKIGKIECAEGGTLFLDEVGELPPTLQVKLLRFLQDRKIERIGGNQMIGVNARVIAATNVDLQKAMLCGRFRADLYFRLAVFPIQLPPLRDRGEDVLLMARVFLNQASADCKKKLLGFTREAIEAIENYSWPGNARELYNRIRRSMVMSNGRQVTPEDLDLPYHVEEGRAQPSLKEALDEVGKKLFFRALTLHNGSLKKVASELQISRPTAYYLLDKYGFRKYFHRQVTPPTAQAEPRSGLGSSPGDPMSRISLT